MVKYLKSYHFLIVNTGTYQTHRKTKMTDWNDNLYPQNYRARSQPQAPSRQPPPGWPKGVRQQSLPSPTSNTENHTNTNITKPSERRCPMMTQRRKRPHSWPKMLDPQLLYLLMETKEKKGQP